MVEFTEIRCRKWGGFALAAFAVLAFAVGGFHWIQGLRQFRAAREMLALRADYQAALAAPPSEAESALENLADGLPEAQIALLRRQWERAVALAAEIRETRKRPALIGEIPAIRDRLRALLEEMTGRADALLADSENLEPDLRWRVRNLRGCVRLMTAFVEMESGENAGPARVLLRSAVSDFAQAIADVEAAIPNPRRAGTGASGTPGEGFANDDGENRTGVESSNFHPALDRRVPRWNLEMLHGNAALRQAVSATPGGNARQSLRQGLETLIPGNGGYSAAAPLDRRVEK
jgi:hypothetical protein